jgi:chorismate mutase
MEHAVLEQAIQALRASDERIVQLLRLRYHLAAQLAQATMACGNALSLEERIAAAVSRLTQGNAGPLDNQRLASIFEMVIRVTEPLSIGLTARNGAGKIGLTS